MFIDVWAILMLACTTGVFGALIGVFDCLLCSGNKNPGRLIAEKDDLQGGR